jgi:branched-chain amino acid transport system permease protein
MTSRTCIYLAWVLVAVLACAAPLFATDYLLRLLTIAVISSVAVVGLNIAFGYAGLISLGHSAFVGLGAYGVAILTTRHGFNPWLASLIAISITSLGAYVIGRSLLRLKGHYLALATLGLNVSFTIVASNWTPVTGGTDGISGLPTLSLFGLSLGGAQQFYWFALVILVLVSLGTLHLRSSHVGRTFIAVRDDELAASMTGIAVSKAKTAAFTFSALLAAVSGCLFAFHVKFVSPEDFAYSHSITYLAMLIVGGEGSIIGAILGTIVITFLPELLRSVGHAYLLVFGTLVLVVLIVMPKGIVSLPKLAFSRKVNASEVSPISRDNA